MAILINKIITMMVMIYYDDDMLLKHFKLEEIYYEE